MAEFTFIADIALSFNSWQAAPLYWSIAALKPSQNEGDFEQLFEINIEHVDLYGIDGNHRIYGASSDDRAAYIFIREARVRVTDGYAKITGKDTQ